MWVDVMMVVMLFMLYILALLSIKKFFSEEIKKNKLRVAEATSSDECDDL